MQRIYTCPKNAGTMGGNEHVCAGNRAERRDWVPWNLRSIITQIPCTLDQSEMNSLFIFGICLWRLKIPSRCTYLSPPLPLDLCLSCVRCASRPARLPVARAHRLRSKGVANAPDNAPLCPRSLPFLDLSLSCMYIFPDTPPLFRPASSPPSNTLGLRSTQWLSPDPLPVAACSSALLRLLLYPLRGIFGRGNYVAAHLHSFQLFSHTNQRQQ